MRDRKGWRHSLRAPGKFVFVSTPASSSNEDTNLQATYTKYMELLILQPNASNKEGVQRPGECSSPHVRHVPTWTIISLMDREVHPWFNSMGALILWASICCLSPMWEIQMQWQHGLARGLPEWVLGSEICTQKAFKKGRLCFGKINVLSQHSLNFLLISGAPLKKKHNTNIWMS